MKKINHIIWSWPLLGLVSWLAVLNWVWGKIGAHGMAWGIPLSLLITSPIVWTFLWLGSQTGGRKGLLLSAFAWGASVAALLSIVSQEGLQGFVNTQIGKDFGHWFGPLIITPVTEELSKGVFLLWLLRYRAVQIPCLLDGIVFGGIIGAGFAFSEQTMYFGEIVIRYLNSQPSDSLALLTLVGSFLLRGLMVPFMHPFFVALVGLGVAATSKMHRRLSRRLTIIAGFLCAIFLHGIWDWAGLASADKYLIYKIYAGVMFPLFLIVATLALRLRNVRGTEASPCEHGTAPPTAQTAQSRQMERNAG